MKRNVTFFITMLALLSMTISVLAQGGKAGEIAIGKAGFFPESVAIYDDVLYTSNFANAEILAINLTDGSTKTFAPAQEGKAGWGLFADPETGVLLSCVAGAGEPFGGVAPTTPNDVNVYSLKTGDLLVSWKLDPGVVCNSITAAGDNTIMLSNIVAPQIIKLDTTTGKASIWSAEEAYAVKDGFGISGLVWDGDSTMYAVANGGLFRVPMNADGTAGTAVQIALTDKDGKPTALATDGLVWVGNGVMVGAENDVFVPGANGRALRVTLGEKDTATVDAIAEGLADPSAITTQTKDGKINIIVANSQMGYMFGVDKGDSPNASFSIVPLN